MAENLLLKKKNITHILIGRRCKKGILNINEKIFKGLSIEAQKFIVGLVNKNPQKRMTA